LQKVNPWKQSTVKHSQRLTVKAERRSQLPDDVSEWCQQ